MSGYVWSMVGRTGMYVCMIRVIVVAVMVVKLVVVVVVPLPHLVLGGGCTILLLSPPPLPPPHVSGKFAFRKIVLVFAYWRRLSGNVWRIYASIG